MLLQQGATIADQLARIGERARTGKPTDPIASGADGTDALWEAMTSPDAGQQPLLQRDPTLPKGYSWNWDGSRLTILYAGVDTDLIAEAPSW